MLVVFNRSTSRDSWHLDKSVKSLPPYMDTYRTAASKGIAVLVDQYKTPGIFDGNFWFGGNALHAYLDYLFRAGETDTNQILPTANKIYQSMSNNPGWWRDDYGWWGIAFVVAINN